MQNYQDIVSIAARNLSSSGFRLAQGVTLQNGITTDLLASRTIFSWKGMVIHSQHVFLCHSNQATLSDFQSLFDEGFLYAKHANRLPLLRGMQFDYWIVPFIAVDRVTPDLIAYATSRPRKHWSLVEFPVLYDISTGQAHSFQKTPLWGGWYFSDLRALTRSIIATT
jgi:hypothetical protein